MVYLCSSALVSNGSLCHSFVVSDAVHEVVCLHASRVLSEELGVDFRLHARLSRAGSPYLDRKLSRDHAKARPSQTQIP